MRTKKWVVKLKEKGKLKEMVSKGYHNSRVLNRARVLLMSNKGLYDKEISQAVGVMETTVCEGGSGSSTL